MSLMPYVPRRREFILEGLYAHRRITRSEEYEFSAGERRQGRERAARR